MIAQKFLPFLFLWISMPLAAQFQKAELTEDGQLIVQEVPPPEAGVKAALRNDFPELEGFPIGFVANPTFKNFRNVTLQNISGDERPELLFGIDDRFYAYQDDSLLWDRSLSGVAIYPPSTADLDGDGDQEIVQVTGGLPARGRVYAFDHLGNDLPGFPLNFRNHWMLAGPTLADVDGDGQMEIIILERTTSTEGDVHLLKLDGTPYNDNWPIRLDRLPAVTASVGDIDGDFQKDIILCSTRTLYAFDTDGQAKTGFPIENPDTWFSFQSPILADLDGDGHREIIGATHGDLPEYYVFNHDGQYRNGWPQAVPDTSWTFHSPTVVQLEAAGEFQIFNSRPVSTDPKSMLFRWNEAGEQQPGFPIVKSGGLEGTICLADVDDNGELDLVFGSNLLGSDGNGFIHAYQLDGSGEVAGFPIRPRGWTFMNGATIGDYNGDGRMNLMVMTYTQTFGAGIDSAFLHAYDLGVSYDKERVLWDTYKGSNSRDGLVERRLRVAIKPEPAAAPNFQISPNPATQRLTLWSRSTKAARSLRLRLFDLQGKTVWKSSTIELSEGQQSHSIALPPALEGLYLLEIREAERRQIQKVAILPR